MLKDEYERTQSCTYVPVHSIRTEVEVTSTRLELVPEFSLATVHSVMKDKSLAARIVMPVSLGKSVIWLEEPCSKLTKSKTSEANRDTRDHGLSSS